VVNCSHTATHGAHVMSNDQRKSSEWFIAPFCNTHNNPHNSEKMFLEKRVPLLKLSG
jgi:hypothetical protein